MLASCGGTGTTTDTTPGTTTKAPAATAAPTTAKPTQGPGDPAVYTRIKAMTNCDQLQEQFNIADANHTRDRGRGRIDLAQIDTSYMTAADDRMREVAAVDLAGRHRPHRQTPQGRQALAVQERRTRLTLDWGFSVLGLHNIMLVVAAWNERAIRVYTKVGSARWGAAAARG